MLCSRYHSLKKEESHRKQLQELSHREASHRIEELEKAKQRLEQEVQATRKRLEVQSLAARQVTSRSHCSHGAKRGTPCLQEGALGRRGRPACGSQAPVCSSWSCSRPAPTALHTCVDGTQLFLQFAHPLSPCGTAVPRLVVPNSVHTRCRAEHSLGGITVALSHPATGGTLSAPGHGSWQRLPE